MDTRTSGSRPLLVLLTSLAFALTLFAVKPAYAQNKAEATAKALQKKAMEEDYLATDFQKAADKLNKAIEECGTDKCSPQVRAQLRRDLGVVLVGGQLDRAKGIQAFADALKIDPSIVPDPDLKTKDLEAAFDEAKKGGGAAAPSGGGKAGGAHAGSGEQPQGDFTHTPAAAQQIRTPIPIYVEYGGEEHLVRVIARYKGFGMSDWKTIELKKTGDKGWGGLIPCADVVQGTTQYYLQGFNDNNDPVATSGDRNHPFTVPVQRAAVANPPHLPDQDPPKQCPDTGDCPPNFPGCKKPGGGVTSEPSGKEGGEYCEEDDECKSNKCEENKCTAPEGPKKTPKVWVGLWAAIDYSFLPSADDVCLLKPTNQNQEPVNDSNYYCVQNGDDYPYRLTGPQDKVPAGHGDNANIVRGTSDKVSGGGAVGNIRIMASLDYAVNMNLLIGGRVGYVLLAYPGQAAKDDGKTFPPLHLELRGTYLIGKDALAKKLAPYAFLAGGVSTWDSSVSVQLLEKDPSSGQNLKKTVDAWHIAGPAFIGLGGGIRVAFSPRAALMAGLRFDAAFGNAFAPSIGPEVGVMMGF